MSYPYSVVKLKGCDYNKINIEAGDGKVQQQKQNAGLSFQLTITEQQVATNPEKQLQQLNYRHFFLNFSTHTIGTIRTHILIKVSINNNSTIIFIRMEISHKVLINTGNLTTTT